VQNDTDARLRRIRGSARPTRHNARTIAALTGNPGCSRRTIVDTAGVDKEKLARHIGFPSRFGQSEFAITRTNAFQTLLRADDYAELTRLLREVFPEAPEQIQYLDLEATDNTDAQDQRYARDQALISQAIAGNTGATLFDHPLLSLNVAGQNVYLEPELLVFQYGGSAYVVQVRSFAVIDGQANGENVGQAALQAAGYVLALRQTLGNPDAAPPEVLLICPKDFSNVPTITRLDIRWQLIAVEYQLDRLTHIDTLLDALPPHLNLDLGLDASGNPTRPATELIDALRHLPARYFPECLSNCDLAFFCRHEATGHTAALGRSVREELGGIETIAEVLGFAEGTVAPPEEWDEAAALLRGAAWLYAESVAAAAYSGESAALGPSRDSREPERGVS